MRRHEPPQATSRPPGPWLLGGAIALFLLLSGCSQRARAPWSLAYGDDGTIDFIQYWSAHRLLVEGRNPYDPDSLHAVEVSQGLTDPTPILMWNPPWLIPLLAPVLSLPFATSSALWLAMSLLLMLAAGLLIVRTYAPDVRPRPIIFAAMFLFQPHLSTLRFGQLGGLLAGSFASFLFGVRRNNAALAGLALVPLTVKPHLFYLVAIFLAYAAFVERRAKPIAWFAVGFGGLLLATRLLYPQALGQWVDAFHRPPVQWAVGTLVGITRHVVLMATGAVVTWPIVVIPGVSALAFTAWLFLRKPRPDLLWRLPAVLAVSMFTSPYGWLFDQTPLIVIQVALFALVHRPSVSASMRQPVILALAVTQIVMAVQSLVGYQDHRYLFWATLVWGAIWVMALRRLDLADPIAVVAAPENGAPEINLRPS